MSVESVPTQGLAVDGTHHSVRDRIFETMGTMSPQVARAAHFVLDHLADVASYSATELADAAGVSKATMSRLAHTLGYASFAEIRHETRVARRAGTPHIGVERTPDDAQIVADAVAAETQHLDALAANAVSQLSTIADRLATARHVVIVGYRSSYPVALYFRQQLMQLRPDVVLLPHPGQAVTEDLVALGAGDAGVVLSFGRRVPQTAAVVSALAAQRTPCIVIADRSARTLGAQSTTFIEVGLDVPGALTSVAAAVSTIGMIVNMVAVRLGRAAQARADAISDGYLALGEVQVDW